MKTLLAAFLATSVLAQQEGDVRLQSSNAVMIYHSSSWRYVCDDYWGMQDAEVVCRQLGLGGASSAPVSITIAAFGNFWLDDVQCTGTEETLSDCNARPWGAENCNSAEGAGAVCSGDSINNLPPSPSPPWGQTPPPPSPSPPYTNPPPPSQVPPPRATTYGSGNEGDVRLESNNAVMIYHSSSWRYVCDDSWDQNDADVVCRQLGFAYATSAPQRLSIPSDSFWLDDVRCSGSEYRLSDCPASSWGNENCATSEGAGAVCARLADVPAGTLFTVSGGGCETDGRCVRSVGDGDYASNQDCTIYARETLTLDVVAYEVESCCDYLSVGGSRYSSSPRGPNGVMMREGDTMTWHSDGSVDGCGWLVCGYQTGESFQTCPPRSFGGNFEGPSMFYGEEGAGFPFYVLPSTFVLFGIFSCATSKKGRRQARQMSRRIQRPPPRPPPRQQITPSAQQVTPLTAAMIDARVQAAREKSRRDRPPDYMYDGPSQSIADEIQKLSELRAQGMLDDEQFEQAKAQLLGTPTVTAMVVDATAIPLDGAQPMVMAQPVMAEMVQPAGQAAVPVAYATGTYASAQAAVPVAYATGTSCQRV